MNRNGIFRLTASLPSLNIDLVNGMLRTYYESYLTKSCDQSLASDRYDTVASIGLDGPQIKRFGINTDFVLIMEIDFFMPLRFRTLNAVKHFEGSHNFKGHLYCSKFLIIGIVYNTSICIKMDSGWNIQLFPSL